MPEVMRDLGLDALVGGVCTIDACADYAARRIDANTRGARGVVVVLLVGKQLFTARCNVVDGEFDLRGELPFKAHVPLEGLWVYEIVARQQGHGIQWVDDRK